MKTIVIIAEVAEDQPLNETFFQIVQNRLRSFHGTDVVVCDIEDAE